jgi:hypothetical protein
LLGRSMKGCGIFFRSTFHATLWPSSLGLHKRLSKINYCLDLQFLTPKVEVKQSNILWVLKKIKA